MEKPHACLNKGRLTRSAGQVAQRNRLVACATQSRAFARVFHIRSIFSPTFNHTPVAQTFQSAVSPTFLSAARPNRWCAANCPASAGWKACETADREVCATSGIAQVPEGRQTI
jgi:hypothetical protein